MKPFIAILALLAGLSAGALAQGPTDLNSGSQLSYDDSTGAYAFSWWGAAGNTYLIETSDDLVHWSYLPIVESGSNAAIQWGFTSTSTSLFMKLEYITVPPGQLTGQAFNGPDNDGDGLPDDWELFYFGHTGVNSNDYVPWSGGTVTNLQAYQQGLNPTDFYNGTLPNLTAVSGTALPCESGSNLVISVQVTDSSSHPIPGAPVIFSIDYGLLVLPDGSGGSQEVEVAADSNGYANVTVIEPLWQGIPYTVTAKAETGGQTTSVQFTGTTESDDPAAPPLPSPAIPNPNSIPEPTLSVEMSGTSIANPAFRQFQVYDPSTGQYSDTPPIRWYVVKTETMNLSEMNNSGVTEATITGTYNSAETSGTLSGGPTWTGTSQLADMEVWNEGLGPPFVGIYYSADSNASQATDGSWSGTDDWVNDDGDAGSSFLYAPPFGPGYYVYWTTQTLSQSTTEMDSSESYYGDSDDNETQSDQIILSDEYTRRQFTTDVINTLPNSPAVSSTGYALGNPIAYRNLAVDASSFSVETGTYSFNCSTTGTAPYAFEWYEVFQPDDDTQPVQATHREWDNANQQAESPEYSIDPSTQTTNGTWYIARLDTQTYAQYPECRWRHVVGIGELVKMSLPGLPITIGTATTWSITPSTSGSLSSTSPSLPFNSFRAGRTPGTVTITVTLPGGATMSTTLTIIAPTGVAYTKLAPYSFPWWEIGAGMWGQYTLLPTTVSFYHCEFQEEKCLASNPSGFFKQTNLLLWHDPNKTSSSPLREPPDSNQEWVAVQQDNSAGQLDLASAIANLIAVAIYDDSCNLDEAGSGFEWKIPLLYRLVDDTDNGVAFPAFVTQSMQISNAYGSYVLKGDASDYR